MNLRQKPREQRKHAIGKKALGAVHMLDVQAIAVEFRNSRRGDDYARRVGELDDVERQDEGLAEGCGETVVWWRGEC